MNDLLIIFLVACLLSLVHGNTVDLDVNTFGETIMSSQAKTIERKTQTQEVIGVSASFRNTFHNETIYLYWEAKVAKDNAYMGHIDANSEISLNSYHGHRFYALLADRITRVYPGSVEIGSETSFEFGPEPPGWNTGKMHPKVKYMNQQSNSIGARFKSLAPEIDIWYENGQGGSYQGSLSLGQETTTNTYIGHVFFFTEKDNKAKEIARYVMRKEQALYLVEDPDFPPPAELRQQIDNELKYIEEYTNRTGVVWRHYYGPLTNGPRSPPKLYMWSTPEIGYIHRTTSDAGFWSCSGPASTCQSKEKLDLQLQVVSIEPKVFVIENLFSDFEADHIMKVAFDKLGLSLVGNKEAGGARTSETRTSRNAWLARETSPILETLFLRASHLLKIDDRLLRPEENAEMLQVVRYQANQKYEPHHDWGVRGVPASRFLTLLLYLNDQVDDNAGGETSFPLAANGRGIKVHPGKGNAVLFYNLLEDGNADELALHSGTSVFNGTKWVANFWVWDPKKL
jgi:prolyl 4-hydroxylase